MPIRLTLVNAFPDRHWEDLHFPHRAPLDWHLDLAFLMYLWEHGEETVLETAFYQPFDENIKFPQLPHFMHEHLRSLWEPT